MPYSCNEGKIQEFRHALVFNHSCVAKLHVHYHVSESEQHKHVTDVKLDSTVMHLDRIPFYGDYLFRKNLIAQAYA